MAKQKKMSKAATKILTGLSQLHAAVVDGDYSKVTIRTVEIAEPGEYGPREVKALRERLDVSQSVFAALVGVSGVLVAHWEHGLRKPAPVVCRLFDKIKENPAAYLASLVRRWSA